MWVILEYPDRKLWVRYGIFTYNTISLNKYRIEDNHSFELRNELLGTTWKQSVDKNDIKVDLLLVLPSLELTQ